MPVRQEVGTHGDKLIFSRCLSASSKSQDQKQKNIKATFIPNYFHALQLFISCNFFFPQTAHDSPLSFSSSCNVCISLCLDFPLARLCTSVASPPHFQGLTKNKEHNCYWPPTRYSTVLSALVPAWIAVSGFVISLHFFCFSLCTDQLTD